jgi:hypothetical protein
MRIRQQNVPWLVVTGAMVGLALLAGVAAQVGVALVGLYAVAAGASLLEFPQQVTSVAQRSTLARMRMSAQAQEAVDRASRRGSYGYPDLTLLDIGLIAAQSTTEGGVMRRTRVVSKDDDGVRPFITLNVAPQMAEQTVVIRFEMLDQNGQQQYVHEMRTYLHEGEMNILADHQLPLEGNDRISGAGDGDLRVSVDGRLLGALSYTLSASMRERARQFTRNDTDINRARRLEDQQPDSPTTLEELLRSQSNQSGGQTRR